MHLTPPTQDHRNNITYQIQLMLHVFQTKQYVILKLNRSFISCKIQARKKVLHQDNAKDRDIAYDDIIVGSTYIGAKLYHLRF
jgi:hypothetical protein